MPNGGRHVGTTSLGDSNATTSTGEPTVRPAVRARTVAAGRGNCQRFTNESRIVAQPITHSGLGQEVSRSRGVFFELLPEMSHIHPEVLSLPRVGGAPDRE